MSGTRRHAAATALAKQLVRVARSHRVDWATAMQSELGEIEDANEALSFILGCVWACTLERFRSLDVLLRLLRHAMVASTAVFAATVVSVAIRLIPTRPTIAILFATIAFAFALMSLLLTRRRPSGSVILATAMLFASGFGTLAYSFTSLPNQGSAFYRALALEELALWSLLLAGSSGLSWGIHSPWLRHRARKAGWHDS